MLPIGIGGNTLDGYNITDSLRFRSSASAYLERTPTTAGNRRVYTISFWIKRGKLSESNTIFRANGGSDATGTYILFDSSDRLNVSTYVFGTGYTWQLLTTQIFRDPSAWYHIIVATDTTQATASDRAKVYINGQLITSYTTSNYPSLNYDNYTNSVTNHYIGTRPDLSNAFFDGYMTEFNLVDGQALDPSDFGSTNADGVWSPKKYTGTYGTNGFYLPFTGDITPTVTAGFGGVAENVLADDDVYLISNTTTGSGFDLVEYDFGESINMIDYNVQDLKFTGGTSTFKIYTSDVGGSLSNYTERASLSVSSSFQNYTGNLGVTARYVKIRATAFGTNGQAHLNYFNVDVDSSIFSDNSGNTNHWTPNNINVLTDSTTDVPTLTDEDTGNFATWNPLDHNGSSASNANLRGVVGNNDATYQINGTMAVSSGKWYWEVTCGAYTTAPTFMIGIKEVSGAYNAAFSSTTVYSWYGNTGNKYNGGNLGTYGATYTTGDVIGVALDLDAGTLTFYKNGVSQGTAFTGISGTYKPHLGTGLYAVTCDINFGQQPFKYTPPTGFKKLNTFNLPDSSITDGSQYFDSVTYTGDGGTSNSLTYGFSPDLVWSKSRSNAESNILYDSVRGTSKLLLSNSTNAENTVADPALSFDSNGHTWTQPYTASNFSGYTYVNWSWRGSDSTAVSNTDGTITSTVSANTTSGFSIVTYTGNGTAGSTVGHGLGSTPKFIITKARTGTNDWGVYHTSIGNTAAVFLSGTYSVNTNIVFWNNTSPTSSVFTIGTNNVCNSNTVPYVAYCFAEVEGFSKFGSYTGNGSTDGPFVYTGFRPAFVIAKRTDATSSWQIWDTARSTYNATTHRLRADLSNAEDTGSVDIDTLSNGFKLRNSGINISGGTYIYMAFAENPFKNSLAR